MDESPSATEHCSDLFPSLEPDPDCCRSSSLRGCEK